MSKTKAKNRIKINFKTYLILYFSFMIELDVVIYLICFRKLPLQRIKWEMNETLFF